MSAKFLRHVHLIAAAAWMFPGVLVAWWICYRLAPEHAAFAILIVSLWANSATHLSAYGAARAEES